MINENKGGKDVFFNTHFNVSRCCLNSFAMPYVFARNFSILTEFIYIS